jgi:photosystem II stability/assembly factor-like uncharacterized protein
MSEDRPAPADNTRRIDDILRAVGRAAPDDWRAALRAKHRQPRRRRPAPPRLSTDAFAHLASNEAGLLDSPAAGERISVPVAENPAPHGSFGFAGVCANVESDQTFTATFLYVSTTGGHVEHLQPDSLRLFRWDATRRRFALVPHSQSHPEAGYVAGRIVRGGLYAVIGLPRHAALLETVRIACGLRDRLRRAGPSSRDAFKKRLCELVLCARDLWPVNTRDSLPIDVCRTCLEMPSDALFDLPECELIGPGVRECRDGAWENLGPFEIVGTTGEAFNRGIGCAKQLAIDPSDHRRVYATGEHGGVWVLHRADQWGDNVWVPIGDALEGLQMRAIAIAPGDSDRLYVGNSLGVVYASHDAGASWTPTSAQAFGFIRRILVHRIQPDTLFVAASSGLFLSVDAGGTWMALLDPLAFPVPDVLEAAMDPADSSVLYIGVRGQGVFKTSDAGSNWQTVLPFAAAAQPDRQMIRLSLGVFNADGSPQPELQRTVAIKLGREVFLGHDGGRTQPVSCGRRGGSGGAQRRSDGGARSGEWCNVIAVDPHDPAIVLAGQQDLLKSTDGGATWRRISGDDVGADGLGDPRRLVHEDFQDIAFDPQTPGVAYLACDGGVYLYNDGRVVDAAGDVDSECFAERNLGLAITQFFRVGVQGQVAVGNLDHNGLKGTTDLAGGRWQKANARGGNNALEFDFVYGDPKRVGRFYTINLDSGGGQLKRLRFPPTADPARDLLVYAPFIPYYSDIDPITLIANYGSLPVSPIAVDLRDGSNVLLVCAHVAAPAGFRLMMTREGDLEPDVDAAGAPVGLPNWEVAFDNGTLDPLVSVVFAPGSPGTACVISATGAVTVKQDVTAGAVDAGWESRGTWTQNDVRQLVVSPASVDRLFAVSGTAFGRSVDGGRTWPAAGVASPTGGRELNSIAVHPSDPETLFIGADTGVFVSYDEGGTWSPYDEGLANAEVMQVFAHGGYLYAVTHGRGLWRRRFC